MAQLAIAAAGAAIGGWIAPGVVALGMTGGSLGWMAGSLIGSAFTPTQKGEGPRLGDLQVGGSSYGSPIPYIAGHPRISGQIIWASTKREIATTQESGGKGGGGSEYTSYTYEVDLLILLSSNEIMGVRRIWSNGELVFTADATADLATLTASHTTTLWARMTAYSGEATQLPDHDYEAVVGSANAPAYRGRGSVFIKSLQLGGGGQIPNLTFEVISKGTLGAVNIPTEGLLCHFDEMLDATYIKSAIGPKMTKYTATLSTTVKKFGAAALNGYRGDNTARAANVLGAVARNWRAEGWFFVPTSAGDGDCFELYAIVTGGVTTRMIRLGWYTNFGDSCVRVGWISSGDSGSGRYGYPANAPSQNQWNHFCIQYIHPNKITIYINGKNALHDFSGGSSTVEYFQPEKTWFESPLTFTRIDIFGSADEFYYHALADDEPIYGNLFGVPAIPFTGYEFIDVIPTITDIAVTLQETVSALALSTMLQAGQFDATPLATITHPVRAMAISQVSSTRTVLEMLAQVFNFDCILRDKLYFIPRATASVVTFTFDEIGISESETDQSLSLLVTNDLEMPTQTAITYSNVDNDYMSDTQYSLRLLKVY